MTTANALKDNGVFKYGIRITVISEIRRQFSLKFFQQVCQMLVRTNAFTTTYHQQTNGQTEIYNRKILEMLCCYVADHQRDWDTYVQALT